MVPWWPVAGAEYTRFSSAVPQYGYGRYDALQEYYYRSVSS